MIGLYPFLVIALGALVSAHSLLGIDIDISLPGQLCGKHNIVERKEWFVFSGFLGPIETDIA